MAELGDLCKDCISGYIGIVTAKSEYLFSSPTCLLQAEGLNHDGEPYKSQLFDEDSIIVVESQKVVPTETVKW